MQEILDNLPNMIILEVDKSKNILQIFPKDKSIQNKFKNYNIDSINEDKDYSIISKELKNTTIYYLQEVSKYQQTLNDLISKKEELQAVFDLAANGISILDRNGMFLYANNFFQKMMEYSMDELKQESCISLSSPEYSESSHTAVEKAIEEGSIEKFRKVCITKSGKHLNASMSLSYLKSRDEIVMITSDITQDIQYQDELKKQVEIEVKKRTEQYEIMCQQSRLAAMGEMIDSIAHQWRQPLNGLGIIVQGLRHLSSQKDFDWSLLKDIEGEIMEKITFMSQTIDDFSTFFRITKEKKIFNILTNINDAIRLIDVQLKDYNINTNIHISDNLVLDILGFANEFRQVMLNIIHNAMMAIIQSQQKNGNIDIYIKETKKSLTLEIEDNGGGILKKNMHKIFDPYFTTKDKGSGIGLYMSKIIIEHHMQGTLNVKNKNDGAKFTITLKR